MKFLRSAVEFLGQNKLITKKTIYIYIYIYIYMCVCVCNLNGNNGMIKAVKYENNICNRCDRISTHIVPLHDLNNF